MSTQMYFIAIKCILSCQMPAFLGNFPVVSSFSGASCICHWFCSVLEETLRSSLGKCTLLSFALSSCEEQSHALATLMAPRL